MYLVILKKNSGFTLVEIIIALAINAFLFTALISFLALNLTHQRKALNINRLNEQLEASMYTMANEIRRAGYWANANSDIGTGQNNNPFMAVSTDLSINPAGNCILFTYDADSNGALPSISSGTNDERFGFRLSEQTLQARPPGAAFDCNASANSWDNMSDPNIVNITNLTFTLTSQTVVTGPGTTGITVRSVDIALTGQLVSDSTVSQTLTEHVRIRNDKFIP